jgi:glycogen operon protein
MATLFVSQGVPMLEMGDELWRTQHGNNNPYCHDSELTWLDWRLNDDGRAMMDIARSLVSFRKRHLVFRRRQFLQGAPSGRSRRKDIMWLRPDGTEMKQSDWVDPARATIAFLLDGDAFEPQGSEVERDASFLILMNGERAETTFVVPPLSGGPWHVIIDTRERSHVGQVADPGQLVVLEAGSLVALTDQASE